MIDRASQTILLDIIRREGRSLLHYVSESFPWITAEEQEALARLQAMVQEELAGTAELARFLAKNRSAPSPLGPYPMSFTNINYVSLDHLLPILVDNQARCVKDLEAGLSRISDPHARPILQRYLDMKRKHLASLEDMARSVKGQAAVSAS
jgi:hypothetical protein